MQNVLAVKYRVETGWQTNVRIECDREADSQTGTPLTYSQTAKYTMIDKSDPAHTVSYPSDHVSTYPEACVPKWNMEKTLKFAGHPCEVVMTLFEDGELYKTFIAQMTVPDTAGYVWFVVPPADIETIEHMPPPPEWKMFDPPPPEFPAVWIPILHELDDAAFENDAEAIKNILRTHAWETASPIAFIAALVLVGKVVTVIATVVGSKAFSAFLFEETLQTIDMAIWEARSAEQWDLAQAAVNKKRELFETTFWDDLLGWIPGVNVIMAVEKFKEASLFKLDMDQELINRHAHYGQAPSTGDIKAYITALESGNPPDLYAPRADCILIANVNVAGGEIIVGDMGWSTLFPVTLNIPSGIVDVTIKSEGYVDKTKTMNIDPYDTHTEDFWLEEEVIPPEKGTLHVTCNVDAGKVYVDGVHKGLTPLTITLDPGSYHVLVTKFQHTSYEEDVTIVKDTTTEVSAEISPEAPPPEKAILNVDSKPQGASIYKDDVDTGFNTPHTFELDPGTYKMTLKLEGYPDAEQTISLSAGQTFDMYYDFTIPYYPPEVEVEVTMTPIEYPYNAWKYRFITRDAVTGAEINAKIFIDDEDTGKWTPWYFYFTELTTYVLKFERYGYHPATITITTEKLPEAP